MSCPGCSARLALLHISRAHQKAPTKYECPRCAWNQRAADRFLAMQHKVDALEHQVTENLEIEHALYQIIHDLGVEVRPAGPTKQGKTLGRSLDPALANTLASRMRSALSDGLIRD